MSCLPDHPNIVRLRATYEDNEAVHLVMELCEGGELFDRIVARGHYSERAAAGVARTVAEVVRMCHENGVMHRDLKPENFLFANKKENAPLKAIDFGLSVFFKPGNDSTRDLMYREIGVPLYRDVLGRVRFFLNVLNFYAIQWPKMHRYRGTKDFGREDLISNKG